MRVWVRVGVEVRVRVRVRRLEEWWTDWLLESVDSLTEIQSRSHPSSPSVLACRERLAPGEASGTMLG